MFDQSILLGLMIICRLQVLVGDEHRLHTPQNGQEDWNDDRSGVVGGLFRLHSAAARLEGRRLAQTSSR